jgi:hypothetical protein
MVGTIPIAGGIRTFYVHFGDVFAGGLNGGITRDLLCVQQSGPGFAQVRDDCSPDSFCHRWC